MNLENVAFESKLFFCITAVSKSTVSQRDLDTDLTPPLEHCIQTR